MKKFTELIYGEKVYIITLKPIIGEVNTLITSFCSKTKEASGEYLIYFKDISEVIKVKETDSIAINESDKDKKIYYSSDILEVENILKLESENARSYIDKLKISYQYIWKNNTPEQSLKRGDFIYLENFNSVVVFDGNDILYFLVGGQVQLSQSTKYRRATEKEIKDAINLLEVRLIRTFGGIRKQLKEILEESGYVINGFKILKKTNKD